MNKVHTMKYALCGAVLSGITLSHTAHAADGDIEFAGFASFVYEKTITDDREESTINGSSISNEGNERDGNRFGLRMNADLKDNLTFTGQLVARGNDDYDPEVDWMFATFQLQPGLELSVGKMRVPLFTYSDYLDVGYAYQWVSPPYSVYGVPSFTSYDGIQLNYNFYLGESWSSQVLVWAGNVEEPLVEMGGNVLTIDDAVGAALTLERDWFSIRAVYFEGDTTGDIRGSVSPAQAAQLDILLATVATDLDPLTPGNDGGLEQLVNDNLGVLGTLDLSSVEDNFVLERDPSTYLGLGMFLDFDTYFFSLEATKVEVDYSVAIGQLNSVYVMGGVRLDNDWTLSLTIAEDDDKTRDEILDNFDKQLAPFVGANPGIDAAINQVRTGLSDAHDTAVLLENRWYTVTARWDFHTSAALKFEFIQSEYEEKGKGTEGDPQALRVGLDLVF